MQKQIVISLSLIVLFTTAEAAWAGAREQIAAFTLLSQGKYAQAVPLLKQLADQGDAQSQTTLATLLWNGSPGVPIDRPTALELYERAAGKMNGEALAALGLFYMNGVSVKKDPAKAFDYLSKSVNMGVKSGKIGLAVCYLKGWGTEQDLAKSFTYTREAAMQKLPGAQYNLAYYFRKGIGTEPNQAEANNWYAKAAPELLREAATKRDSYEYQIALAEMYANGWGVPKDSKKAAQYFSVGLPLLKKAMAGGDKSNAFLTMAELANNGWGVTKNRAEAVALWKKAAAMGDKEASWVLSQEGVPQ